jgi:alpha-1,6-mannosyltransferase
MSSVGEAASFPFSFCSRLFDAVKICDLTQFYSPLSGGVKRYVHEKIEFIQKHSPHDEHVLIVPGPRTEMVASERSRIYSIHSPLLSRTSRYRALLNLRAVEEIIERERPDIIESSDPYQIAWKAIAVGAALHIPVVGFYHSHFLEAYLRSASKFLGRGATEMVMSFGRRYVGNLYNRFAATFVPAEPLAKVLSEWGVANVRLGHLGVNAETFRPNPEDGATTRASLGIKSDKQLLLYVGRLAKEKNTRRLFEAFSILEQRRPGHFHLLIVGDGPEREWPSERRERGNGVSWIPYCTDSADLARYYRAADLFVHPGVQETFGLVALESQACGTPVVGIHGSYMDRVILHDQASWARENSSAALADAIDSSAVDFAPLSRSQLSDLASRLYSWPRVFEQLFCIYREVCAHYRRT